METEMDMTRTSLVATLAVALLAGVPGGADAAEHQVQMRDRGAAGAMVFEPALLRVAPGDTVRFVAASRGHNAESLQVMTPEGATMFRGSINEEITVTFERPGVYGYQCKPHYGLGMVGVIVVGEGGEATANLEQARAARHPTKARDRFQRIFGEMGS
jgi:pseudoazurin